MPALPWAQLTAIKNSAVPVQLRRPLMAVHQSTLMRPFVNGASWKLYWLRKWRELPSICVLIPRHRLIQHAAICQLHQSSRHSNHSFLKASRSSNLTFREVLHNNANVTIAYWVSRIFWLRSLCSIYAYKDRKRH